MKKFIVITLSLLLAVAIHANNSFNSTKLVTYNKEGKRYAKNIKLKRGTYQKGYIIGTRVNSVPNGYVIEHYNGINYRVCNGVWYKPKGNKFLIVRVH